jgi:Ca-activated chloride channel family protein
MRSLISRRTLRLYLHPALAAIALAGCSAGTLGDRENEAFVDADKAMGEQSASTTVVDAMAPPPALPSAVAGLAAVAVAERYERDRIEGDPGFNTEAYSGFDDNPFLAVAGNPLSTFSIDVDRASYANVRRFLREGRLPPRDAVRIEELVNYFTFDDPSPAGDSPFAVQTELGAAPWRPGHLLLRVGLKARAVDTDRMPASNLVFLMDVSGSMDSPDKLPLLKQAFALLVNELREQDRVAIVVYAGAAGVVLESTPGDRKERILSAIERLQAGGSTAGGQGIRLAYDIARQNHIDGGNNRVILATDGDFNIGASSDAEMMRLVEEKRTQGTFLTVLGFGTGNIKDSKMETLADHGNGNYAYIDGVAEARKVLVHEMGGTLLVVAKDVKLQIEFNPAKVRAYRLIGYENRLLAAEDFNNDAKDAGELGAGHSVTALYEIVPVGADTDVEINGTDPLRYRTEAAPAGDSDELAFVKLRYKAPDGDRSRLLEVAVEDGAITSSTDLTFAAAVASFGMLLRESAHAGSATFDSVLALARDGRGDDESGYRAGFIEMVEAARTISARMASR